MEKDQISTGNPSQLGSKNEMALDLMMVQLRILAIRPDTNQEIRERFIEMVTGRIATLQTYTGVRSKSQNTQLDTLVTYMSKFNDGKFYGEESIKDLFERQEELSLKLEEKLAIIAPKVIRAKKIRITGMSPSTKSTIRRYMRISRKIFNQCVDLQNKGAPSKQIRDFVVRISNISEEHEQISEHVRQKAFDKFSSSNNATDSLGGHLGFISGSKDEKWAGFQHRDCVFKDKTLILFGKMKLELKESVPSGLAVNDLEITESHGIFHVMVPHSIFYSKPPEFKTLDVRCCALDMGERTFGTLYDPSGTIASIGMNVQRRVNDRLNISWKITNALKRDDFSMKKRKKLEKRKRKASNKLKNMIKDMHHKVANWLVQKYDTIIIGKLGIGVMKCKRRGKRVIQTLSHYSFRRTLLQKASVAQKNVSVVSEWFTTKQCNQCGHINWKIGSNEEFSCNNCKVVVHRDIHSARGIFIKSLS